MDWKQKLSLETKEKMRLIEESDLPENEKNRLIIELARELGKRLQEQEAGRSGQGESTTPAFRLG